MRIDPHVMLDGTVAYYEALIEPLSVWEERQQPRGPAPIQQVFYGPVGNNAAVTGGSNVAITQAATNQAAHLIDQMVKAVQHSDADDEAKADYAIDADQLKGELHRSRKDPS